MLIALIIIIVVIVAALLLYGLMQSPSFSVVREADFNASQAKVFDQLNDFRNWTAWSPWEGMDPNLKRTYSGADAGVGAHYAWVGNKKVGEGVMHITQSEKPNRMQLDLNFIKPFQASNITEFTLTPKDKGTHLKWEMRGTRPFLFRVLSFVFDMDKIVGKDFEKGLASIKTIVEK
ncbi:SRPBCC family protein [Aestuariivirga litoralis]|uniref:SRPBCC family protein n=1 Tax=Aestuariivirga litoralis TaxID=2650924 RepID=UPI0018C75EF1|nr:SRPBCC family protein [Aestuariivirga litoralis]MBG1233087.1 SRPBCC family protein [Aestuariivirga litoralis]